MVLNGLEGLMAFEVTATRKRPRSFDMMAGQEFVVATMKRSLEMERIAHAYLFSGPRGVGKTSAARILAKGVNCQEGVTPSPCDKCPSCIEIGRGCSLDVIEIDGASNTSVNDVRAIREEVLFTPNSCRYKVYIIDEVHMLSNSAFNALLKTIEEPPPYVIFVFATTEGHKIPATIRSRCQQFHFRLISTDVIKDVLSQVCSDDGIAVEDEALFWIAKEAAGSMRDAFTLLDQVASFSDGKITLAEIRSKLGLVGLDSLNGLMESAVDRDGQNAMLSIDAILLQGVSVEQLTVELGEYFRNLLFLRHGVESETLLGHSPNQFSSKVVGAFSVEQLEMAVEMSLALYRNIKFSLNPRYELELLVSQISRLQDYLTRREMLSEIKRLKGAVFGSVPTGNAITPPDPARGASADTSPERARGGIPREEVGGNIDSDELKNQLIRDIKSQKPALAAALEQAVEWRLDDSSLTIVFRKAYTAQSVKHDTSLLVDKAEALVGWKPSLIVQVEEGEAADTTPISKPVEMVKKVFQGEIIRGAGNEPL